MILVAGATGLVGMEVCRKLLEQGEPVRALVRSTSAVAKLDDLRRWGAELHVGDLKMPATLRTACDGVEAVISTASSTFSRQAGDSIASVDAQGQLDLVSAAKSAGVGRFVFVSFRHSPQMPFPLSEAKAQVEQSLGTMDATIIRASFFMEVWLSPALGFDVEQARARVFGEGTARVSWVSYKDVAQMCVTALRHPAASRRSIDFGGPEALSQREVVRYFERAGSRQFTLEQIPEQLLREQFDAATEPMEKTFAALMLGAATGDSIDMDAVQAEFGLALLSVENYARRLVGIASTV